MELKTIPFIFMGKIRDIQKKLSGVEVADVEKQLLKIVRDNEQVITSMNTDQLFEGMRSDGSDMPPYSKASVEIYGKPDGPIRLFDEGDFYRGFFIHAEKFPVLIDSKDTKTTMLVEGTQFRAGYGEQIFGLTKENQAELNKVFILEGLQNYYRSLFKV